MKVLIAVLFFFLMYPVNAVIAQADSKTVTWADLSNNEDGFRVERNLNGGPWQFIANTQANTTSYLDTTLNPGPIINKYCFRVAAFNSAGMSAFTAVTEASCWSVAAIITIPNVPGPTQIK